MQGSLTKREGLIQRVRKSLKDAGGASAQYQHIQLQLRAFSKILADLQQLQPAQNDIDYVNALRHVALSCQFPLRDFMAKVEKFEETLGPHASKRGFSVTARKAQWGVSMAQEVQQLHITMTGSIMSLMLLMQSQSRSVP